MSLRGLARVAPVRGVELVNVFGGEIVIIRIVAVGPEQQIGQRVEPRFVSLTRRRRESDPAARADHLQTLAMEPRRVRVVIRDHPDRLDGNALGLELGLAGQLRVMVTPIQRASVRMHPEVPTMPSVGHLARDSFAGVLPQIFSDHCLSYRLDHARIRVRTETVGHSIRADVEPLIQLRGKGRQRRPSGGLAFTPSSSLSARVLGVLRRVVVGGSWPRVRPIR